jgi:glutathione synthase/RimK-type ligase-like ATP-grasp enzyme
MYDIVVLTEKAYINPKKADWYVQQVLDEDNYVLEALSRAGFSVCKKAWCDPEFDWGSTKAVMFRTTWDYFDRYAEFSVWLQEVSKTCALINSAELIDWNIDKRYLLELQKKGVNVASTQLLEKGSSVQLAQKFASTGWSEAVLKPVVSGAARHTYRITTDNVAEHQEILEKLLTEEHMFLQEFLNDIVEFGEISLMFMGGVFTHAIRKIAKSGDFRVQDDHGGRVVSHLASAEEIAFGGRAIAACPELPTYARVDIVRDNSGELSICELELIEPELWFRENPAAADELAKACLNLV